MFVNRDVTEQRRQEHEAAHDVLTGLPNRRRLVGRIRDAGERVRRGGGPMAVLFLDLNGFKPVNDRHGHAVGDELLIRIAGRLAGTVRSTDFVARLGGDEFVVVLEQFGAVERVMPVLQRILHAVEEPMELSTATVASPPASAWRSPGTPGRPGRPAEIDPEHLVKAADEAMYRAKRRPGRDRVRRPGPRPPLARHPERRPRSSTPVSAGCAPGCPPSGCRTRSAAARPGTRGCCSGRP